LPRGGCSQENQSNSGFYEFLPVWHDVLGCPSLILHGYDLPNTNGGYMTFAKLVLAGFALTISFDAWAMGGVCYGVQGRLNRNVEVLLGFYE